MRQLAVLFTLLPATLGGCFAAQAAVTAPTPRPASLAPASRGAQGSVVRPVTPAEAARFLAATPGAAFIDVREPDEYAEGHARGAQLRPLGQLPAWAGSLKATQPVVLICRSGSRSARAAAALEARGFKTLLNVQGGTMAWEAQQLPMER
ncbi:MAG: rhodanese-like domain-containing protein [Candidatus Sericytochromatia bacterium]|nr:rhodanese-like domain-containing protein [Candidatus Sericytochromatia bacterium]